MISEWFDAIKKLRKPRCYKCNGELKYSQNDWGCTANCQGECRGSYNIGWSRMMYYHKKIQEEKEDTI